MRMEKRRAEPWKAILGTPSIYEIDQYIEVLSLRPANSEMHFVFRITSHNPLPLNAFVLPYILPGVHIKVALVSLL